MRCETDDWAFDPRYTNGKCPICGWAPEGVPTAPRWLALSNRVDWQMVGLFMLVDVLFFLALIVAHAVGLITGHPTLGVPSSHPGGGVVASSARLP
ncbi:MAG TPA: hypothetical protein VNA65_06220 [Candidatus Dormibacteraeota bacterium]|nr:hypothetical protein [Candidatus Dormibacteraeota bacterium]